MKKRILRYFRHVGITLLVLFVLAVFVGLQVRAILRYGEHPARLNLNNEGPYVFAQNDSTWVVNYIHGDKEAGFYLKKKPWNGSGSILASCYFALDSTRFEFSIDTQITSHPSIYEDNNPIVAISDIEGGFQAFRDFLIGNGVINEELKWIFGKGHLVLVGDFVDRGWSVTQVLWLIYKLDQEARQAGGRVHFIIGNHELKNMQGFYESAADKYYAASAIMGRQHHQLYDSSSFLGRWMSRKNSIEKINGYLFVHGGLHPDLKDSHLSLDEINNMSRSNYRKTYYPRPHMGYDELVLSNRKGICWYRGYFEDGLTQEEVDGPLDYFEADAVVVGHTVQTEVTSLYNDRVIAIDVRHPKDYLHLWPFGETQGLLIKDQQRFRIFADGSRELLP
ncbi:metallophosphoesterase [Reichenbachiella ulvae]|uniref:Metallophosphoesterase n=1 Tax=Reichenbachiella ulvae TaxID=2980104 RepID=A0ABT3CTF7_9BACT|nr:metallophosphoesterase [Reichenbachiella ulvae]MCV9386866.1 metallophosphoesterase [Reichenbachiella ulvae]